MHDKPSIPTEIWHVYEAIAVIDPLLQLFAILEYHSMSQSCSTFAIKYFWQILNMICNFAKLTEHLQNMHGSLCSIKFTWQQNNSRQGLREITKSLKSETLRSLLCMLVLVTTEITKIHGIHPWKEDIS